MSMSRTALSILMGKVRRAALDGVRLREVMSVYVVQASMASWVIVRSCTRLRVLRAGVSSGGGEAVERMPKSAIR